MFHLIRPQFSAWTPHWSRPRPSMCLDVPYRFGLCGLYVIAKCHDRPKESGSEQHLNPAVVYIGQSFAGLEQRLEYHEVVRRISLGTAGDIWMSTWHIGWTTFDFKSKSSREMAQKLLLCVEADLIRAYRARHGHLPEQNAN